MFDRDTAVLYCATLQMVVLGSDHSALQEDIDRDLMPLEYGGTCTTPLNQSEEELNLCVMVRTCCLTLL
jgi:hypothetical protein